MSKDESGWTDSAGAWIANMGEDGDNGRRNVLDPAFRARFAARRYRRALDVGCGEGRMCRMMQEYGTATTGVDPTPPMIEQARRRDPKGDYRLAGAERLPLPDASFDLVIASLVLIDIPDFHAAIREMGRVLEPGGTLLTANLTPLQTAGMGKGWQYDAEGRPSVFGIDNYSTEWALEVAWSGIRILNWHRPFSAYVRAYLAAGLTLVAYEDLKPSADHVDEHDRYARAPWFDMMEWRKPG